MTVARLRAISILASLRRATGAFCWDRPVRRAHDVAPALDDLCGVVGRDRLERHLGVDHRDDLRRRHHVVQPPAVRVANVHVLDKAHDMAAAVEVAGHRQNAVLVDAALDYHVDLDRPEAGRGGGLDPRQHALDREADVVERGEHLVVEAVEADGDPVQSGVLERPRLPRQCRWLSWARSPSPGIRASCSTSRFTSRRMSGSPPVRRIFVTPWSPTKIRARRSISSNVSNSARSRNS